MAVLDYPRQALQEKYGSFAKNAWVRLAEKSSETGALQFCLIAWGLIQPH